MAKTFLVMKTNVGNLVHDTSSDMLTKIGVWINDAYQDAWRRFLWEDLIAEIEFDSTKDKQDYSIATDVKATDFGKDLYLTNVTDGKPLRRYKQRDWWRERSRDFGGGDLDSGSPSRYVIINNDTLRLDPPPDAVKTYNLLYQKTVADLAADANTPAIKSISTYLEKNATSFALAYKNQYSKANWWANTAEAEFQKLVREENKKVNQIYQRRLYSYGIPRIRRLLGDKSYDTV